MRDKLDRMIADIARAEANDESVVASSRHLSEGQMVAHLSRTLSSLERAEVITHLADCELCCDRLEMASELVRVDVLGGAPVVGAWAGPQIDIGAALLSLRAGIGGGRVHVAWSDAEMQVGAPTQLRRGAVEEAGVSFVRQFVDGALRVELITGRAGVAVGVTLDGAPSDCRASLIVGGKLTCTEPLIEGRAWIRDVPLRLSQICLETSRGVLGHVRLELDGMAEDGGEGV